MAFRDISAAPPTLGELFYLDSSVVFPLAENEAIRAGKPVPGHDAATAGRMSAFLMRAQLAKAKAITSLLALEELAAKTRNTVLRAAASRAGHGGDWKVFARADPAGYATAATDAQAKTVQMLKYAVAALAGHAVVLDAPAMPAGQTVQLTEKLRKFHQDLLANYADLDAMDALHLTLGAAMGARLFVSLDRGWRAVARITVCG